MKTVMIIGCGGIGRAIAKQAQKQPYDLCLISRSSTQQIGGTALQCHPLSALPEALQLKRPDLIVNTMGFLHDTEHMPEKNLQQVNKAQLLKSFEVNTYPTAYIAQCLAQVMQRDTALQLVSLSARVSSISDNHLGGWYSYRMSKAALNMLIKNIAIEWQRQFPKASIYGYHPGTVDTALSKPFQANVPARQLFTPEQAANDFFSVLAKLSLKDSGGLFDWQGQRIDF